MSDDQKISIPISYVVNSRGERTGVLLNPDDFEHIQKLANVALVSLNRTDIIVPVAHRPPMADGLKSVAETNFTICIPEERVNACAHWRYPTMVVLKGAVIADELAEDVSDEVRTLYGWLRRERFITEVDGALTCAVDIAFKDATEAATIVCGKVTRGYRSWKDADGKTLKDLGFAAYCVKCGDELPKYAVDSARTCWECMPSEHKCISCNKAIDNRRWGVIESSATPQPHLCMQCSASFSQRNDMAVPPWTGHATGRSSGNTTVGFAQQDVVVRPFETRATSKASRGTKSVKKKAAKPPAKPQALMKCPICQALVKKENLAKHKKKAH